MPPLHFLKKKRKKKNVGLQGTPDRTTSLDLWRPSNVVQKCLLLPPCRCWGSTGSLPLSEPKSAVWGGGLCQTGRTPIKKVVGFGPPGIFLLFLRLARVPRASCPPKKKRRRKKPHPHPGPSTAFWGFWTAGKFEGYWFSVEHSLGLEMNLIRDPLLGFSAFLTLQQPKQCFGPEAKQTRCEKNAKLAPPVVL